MTIYDILRDIAENKRSGLLRTDNYFFLFKDGKLLEVSGKTTNREQALNDIIENEVQNFDFQEIDKSTLISFQEPMDIIDKIPKKKKGREIKLDENYLKKVEQIKMIVPNINKIVYGKVKGEILAYDNFTDEELEVIANRVDSIYEQFSNINDLILNSENSTIFIKFRDDKYILCELNDISSVGILRVISSEVLR